MGCNVQVALDLAGLDEALYIAREVSPFVDIIEAGTPLIKSVGLEVVRALREQHPKKLIVADMKSTDVGAFEANMGFDAGADFSVVSGITTLATIGEVQRVANERGRGCIVDLTGVANLMERCQQLLELKVNNAVVHRSIDEELTLGTSWTAGDIENIGPLCDLGMDVSIAGGLGPGNLPRFTPYSISTVVIGRSITAHENPAAAAKEYAELISELWP